jgi:hypothetical protein
LIERRGDHVDRHDPLALLGRHHRDEGADHGHRRGRFAHRFGEPGVVSGLPFLDRDHERQVESQHLGAAFRRGFDRLGVVRMPEHRQLREGFERFLIDRDDDDVRRRQIAAREEVQVAGLKVQKLEKLEVAEEDRGGDAGRRDGGDHRPSLPPPRGSFSREHGLPL